MALNQIAYISTIQRVRPPAEPGVDRPVWLLRDNWDLDDEGNIITLAYPAGTTHFYVAPAPPTAINRANFATSVTYSVPASAIPLGSRAVFANGAIDVGGSITSVTTVVPKVSDRLAENTRYPAGVTILRCNTDRTLALYFANLDNIQAWRLLITSPDLSTQRAIWVQELDRQYTDALTLTAEALTGAAIKVLRRTFLTRAAFEFSPFSTLRFENEDYQVDSIGPDIPGFVRLVVNRTIVIPSAS